MFRAIASLAIAFGLTAGGIAYASTQPPARPTVTTVTAATMPSNPPTAGELRSVVSGGFYTARQQEVDNAKRAVRPNSTPRVTTPTTSGACR